MTILAAHAICTGAKQALSRFGIAIFVIALIVLALTASGGGNNEP